MATAPKTKNTKIAIACQGGGSQTAFTAGVLKALLDRQVGQHFDVVGVSGTSGGAVCATLVWYGFLNDDHPRWRRLIDFWKDNTAQNWIEHAFNEAIVQSLRMVNSGLFPMLQLSPSSPFVKSAMAFATFGSRPTFADFPALLREYIDFGQIAAWGPSARRPVLVIGAANVSTGKLAKFVSARETIRLEHILASCCVPNIFPAVQIDGELYWDGLFSDNPPVEALMRPIFVSPENVPEEIWVIKINPTASRSSLEQPAHILDRRNQVEGNISLFQQLDHVEMLNDMLLDDAFRPEYLSRFDVKAPIRIPKSFSDEPNKPYHIPWIEMPDDVQERLDYEGKIDRSPRNIESLIALGEASVEIFLTRREAAVAANPHLVRE